MGGEMLRIRPFAKGTHRNTPLCFYSCHVHSLIWGVYKGFDTCYKRESSNDQLVTPLMLCKIVYYMIFVVMCFFIWRHVRTRREHKLWTIHTYGSWNILEQLLFVYIWTIIPIYFKYGTHLLDYQNTPLGLKNQQF